MTEFFSKLFDTSDYPPRWFCGNWASHEGWLHIISDVTIFLAYAAIPTILIYFILQRKDVPFIPIIWLFAAFILLCGFGHLNEAIIFWFPFYRFAGLEKAATATVSVATVIALAKIIPHALTIPSIIASKERMQKIIEAAPTALIAATSNLSISQANQHAQKLFQYSQSNLQDTPITYLFRDPKNVITEHLLSDTPSKKEFPFSEYKLYGIHSNSSKFPIDLSINPIDDNKHTIFLISINDISDHIRTQRKIQQHARQLERSNKDLNDFAYIASHDLKSPLRGIDSLASWVIEDASEHIPEESKKHLQKMKQRISRMESLLDDLLKYSRASTQYNDFQNINTFQLVTDIADLLHVPDNCSININSNLPTVTTAKPPLDLVFRNLITNAIKHRDPNNSTKINVSASSSGSDYLFTVKDNGPGIPKEYHDRIFNMFTTLKPRDQTEGSGIGLALVKKVVETHGGSITIDSEPESGAAFSFSWPKNPQDSHNN